MGSEGRARGHCIPCNKSPQYLKQATTVSGPKGVVDLRHEHTPFVVVHDVELDASPFFDGLLCDSRCLDANA